MAATTTHRGPVPTQTTATAREALLQIEKLIQRLRDLDPGETITVQFGSRKQRDAVTVEVPTGAAAAFKDVLEAMAAGRGVTVVPENTELTTTQAAAALNVSRPYLIKLLDEGVILHRKVGSHRRIPLDDLLAYKNRVYRERQAVLEELTKEAQREGYGY